MKHIRPRRVLIIDEQKASSARFHCSFAMAQGADPGMETPEIREGLNS